jgi:hypothetical protein
MSMSTNTVSFQGGLRYGQATGTTVSHIEHDEIRIGDNMKG